MGLDEVISVPPYTLKDGQLYVHSLGTLEPLTVGRAGKRLEQHRVDGGSYARVDPVRASRELALADTLSALMREQALGAKAA